MCVKQAGDETDIEITPQMIEAGACVLRENAEECFGYMTTFAESVAELVFLAMAPHCASSSLEPTQND